MEITYKNKKLQKVCTNASIAEKTYGRDMAVKIHLRIDQIKAAESVEQMMEFNIGRCHPLHNNRKGQFAVDLAHPYRMVFEVDAGKIQIANIMEIVDYH